MAGAAKVAPKTKGMKKKQVLIVGAGAAGTAAAYSLGKQPDRFEVQLWEKASGNQKDQKKLILKTFYNTQWIRWVIGDSFPYFSTKIYAVSIH